MSYETSKAEIESIDLQLLVIREKSDNIIKTAPQAEYARSASLPVYIATPEIIRQINDLQKEYHRLEEKKSELYLSLALLDQNLN